MRRYSSKIWKGADKLEFEAYPFFTTLFLAEANKIKDDYYGSFENFLIKFENGLALGFLPNKNFFHAGRKAIRDLLAGNSVFLSLQRKYLKEIALKVKFLSHLTNLQKSDIKYWLPSIERTFSEAGQIIYSFDKGIGEFLSNLEFNNRNDYLKLSSSLQFFKPSYIQKADDFIISLDKKYPGNITRIYSEFVKKYGWLQNSYKGSFNLSIDWLKTYLKQIEPDKKSKLKIKYSVPKNLSLLAKSISFGVALRDDRKKMMQIAISLMDDWLRMYCLKNRQKYETLKWLTLYEILSKKRSYFQLANLCERKKKRLGVMTKFGYNDVSTEFFSRIERIFEKCLTKEIKGTCGNKGKIKGLVKIIIDPKNDSKKFTVGNILVTSMTRPEFLPLMKKASAFITDEGGMTCHAAIVSRELNIPCIIGTKIATKVLRDGDRVEVDASGGIVRKLSR